MDTNIHSIFVILSICDILICFVRLIGGSDLTLTALLI